MVDTFRALGAIPTPMASTEVYMAAKQGVIDGAEWGPLGIIEQKSYETAKYYTLTKHFNMPGSVGMSAKWFNGLQARVPEGHSGSGRGGAGLVRQGVRRRRGEGPGRGQEARHGDRREPRHRALPDGGQARLRQVRRQGRRVEDDPGRAGYEVRRTQGSDRPLDAPAPGVGGHLVHRGGRPLLLRVPRLRVAAGALPLCPRGAPAVVRGAGALSLRLGGAPGRGGDGGAQRQLHHLHRAPSACPGAASGRSTSSARPWGSCSC